MEHDLKSSHTTYDIKYHLVWITKYRKRILTGEIANRVRHLWARGYFAASSGNITDEVIMKYIELQGKEPEDG